ncbi:hypothetical protein [Paenibacillus sp. Soil750]|uniref:hypothetical protein n=1 Tax=Paenibacillus sp. Soil750 TaxID=1736398 RepID=UPI0006F27973|nr:hypothetical protein [Paenibacillus sp. Soil750]KRE69882.1 hypothetical protein ASL11_16105 [Paenibacillus sp. Soil750]
MGKTKGSRRREKLIGTIAGVTALAAPMIMVPVEVSYAKQDPVPTTVEKIQTIVIPKNGMKYIDLNALYNASYLEVDITFEEEQSEDHPVSGAFTKNYYDGIYEIKADHVGAATFTVTGERYEGEEYTTITDSFKVIVVENSEDPDDYKIDISNVIPLMNQSTYTQDQVTDFLENISPTNIASFDSITYNNGNSAPQQIRPFDFKIKGVVGESIRSVDIENRINSYLRDSNEDSLDFIYSEENNPNFEIGNYCECSEWEDIIPQEPGDFDLKVTITDHRGGFTKVKIPFQVAAVNTPPQVKSNSVLAAHVQSSNNPVLFLSNDAMIDLNEIFYDTDENLMHFELYAEFQVSSSDFVSRAIDLNQANVFSWKTLGYSNEYPARIKEIRANDISHPNQPKTVLKVDIERTDKDPFPESINLYQSIQGVGKSSFILDYQSARGFNDSSITISNSDLQNYATGTVTASVYQNHYLKFDAGYGANDWTTKMKVYAHDSNPNHLYLDDFNFRLASAQQTPNLAGNPAIQLSRLYPDNQYNYEFWNTFTENEYVTMTTPENIVFGFDSGSYIATYSSSAVSGTSDILRFDPFNGASVFYVPFKKQ